MSQLHDRTRRRLALTAFALLCVAPTALVAAWGLSRQMPGHVSAEAERLSWHLGSRVTLDAVRHPKPGKVVYEGFRLTDPETGAVVLRSRRIEADWTARGGQSAPAGTSLRLTALEPEVRTDQLDRLWRLVNDTLVRRSGRPAVNVSAGTDRLTLSSAGDPFVLEEVQGQIRNDASSPQAELRFHLAGVETSEQAILRVYRNRATTPPTTGFELSTGDGQLPCSLLALGLSPLQALGPNSTFLGRLWAAEMPGGWAGETRGRFTGVDLGPLVADRTSQQLTGAASVTLDPLRFHQRRIVELVGSISAGPGVIGRTLLDAAVRYMHLPKGAGPTVAGPVVAYEQLAASFALDHRGLQLQGRCDSLTGGVLLAGGNGPLLGEPATARLPVVTLIQTLAPPQEYEVSANRQTQRIMGWMPVD